MSAAEQYTPCPLDTAGIQLPAELEPLAEQIARNVHETWAEGRRRQGWTYGAVRNDKKRTHPCLVPYEQLSEEEKDYDRATSIATLKFILHQGFNISRGER